MTQTSSSEALLSSPNFTRIFFTQKINAMRNVINSACHFATAPCGTYKNSTMWKFFFSFLHHGMTDDSVTVRRIYLCLLMRLHYAFFS